MKATEVMSLITLVQVCRSAREDVHQMQNLKAVDFSMSRKMFVLLVFLLK